MKPYKTLNQSKTKYILTNETGSNLSLGKRFTVLSKRLGRKCCCDATLDRCLGGVSPHYLRFASLLKRKGDIFGTIFIIKTDKAKMLMTSREHNQVLEVHRYYICFSKSCIVFEKKKTTNDEFCFVVVSPQTNLRFLCT